MNPRIGVMAGLVADGPCFKKLTEFGLSTCQLVSWEPQLWNHALASRVRAEARTAQINITAFWSGYTGPHEWNFTRGPVTLGLVPEEFRALRAAELKRAGDFARQLGVKAIITHLGFIPENPTDPQFPGVVAAVRDVALYHKNLGLEFWFETGQETPTTLLRLIHEVGTGNLGINLDPANLILYGKGNPIDALDVFGNYVRNVHAKDGLYPTSPMQLGEEVRVGTGRVRFPEFVKRLNEIGYTDEYIIEREISGKQQDQDIAETVKYLEKLLG